MDEKVKTQQQQNKQANKKSLPEPGIEPGTSSIPARCVTLRPRRQLNVLTQVKLLICFNVMGRNINKQSQICWPHFFNEVFSL